MNAPFANACLSGSDVAGPRFREAGDLTLDLAHHDARVEDVWLGLHPREFSLLWRLAERPGEPVTDTQLAADLWRFRFGCETGSIAAQIEDLRTSLETVGLARLIATDGEGGYFLDLRADPMLPVPAPRGH